MALVQALVWLLQWHHHYQTFQSFDVVMTGEITLRGEVLEIGGLKEKLLAALCGGIKEVIIPKDNEKDLVEIPDNVKKSLKTHPLNL